MEWENPTYLSSLSGRAVTVMVMTRRHMFLGIPVASSLVVWMVNVYGIDSVHDHEIHSGGVFVMSRMSPMSKKMPLALSKPAY